jgi:hypothetical protein
LASWRRKPGRKRNNMADYKNEFGFFAERPKVEKKLFDRNKVIAGLVIWGKPWPRRCLISIRR